MGDSTSIKQLISEIAGGASVSSGVEIGIVSSASPLTVKLPNDSKMTLYDTDLVVPEHLTDYEIEITSVEGKKKIKVHGALKKGDEVYLLTYNDGKKYFIIDRVGGG
jgi:hypothetical protein